MKKMEKIDFLNLSKSLDMPVISSNGKLTKWLKSFASLAGTFDKVQNHGDLLKYLDAIDHAPEVIPSSYNLTKDVIQIGRNSDINDKDSTLLTETLKKLHPWRKGPWNYFGVYIDGEWRSDMKWKRISPHIDLNGKTALDVGCNNCYYSFRMLGSGARFVAAVDPTLTYMVQAYFAKSYIDKIYTCINDDFAQAKYGLPLLLIPCTLELTINKEMFPHNDIQCFDYVFSMGVFYHRRSPFDHLLDLKSFVVPGGNIILETLVIDGGMGEVLVPTKSYAQMNNVWFLPSIYTMNNWLKKVGFTDIKLVSVETTTQIEQRQTKWMCFKSLDSGLDSHNKKLTIEGLPAPKRAIWIIKADK